jgi:hypothetical protein
MADSETEQKLQAAISACADQAIEYASQPATMTPDAIEAYASAAKQFSEAFANLKRPGRAASV